MAASAARGLLWVVDIKTASSVPAASLKIDGLLPLRDGRTFLLSASPSLSLFNVALEGDMLVGPMQLNR